MRDAQLVEVLDEGEAILVGDRLDAAGHPRRLSCVCRGRPRPRPARSTGAVGVAAAAGSLCLGLVVVVVVVAGDRAFELADAAAEDAAQLRQPFRAEDDQGDDQDDRDL